MRDCTQLEQNVARLLLTSPRIETWWRTREDSSARHPTRASRPLLHVHVHCPPAGTRPLALGRRGTARECSSEGACGFVMNRPVRSTARMPAKWSSIPSSAGTDNAEIYTPEHVSYASAARCWQCQLIMHITSCQAPLTAIHALGIYRSVHWDPRSKICERVLEWDGTCYGGGYFCPNVSENRCGLC